MPKSNLTLADNYAAYYDNQIGQNNWTGPEYLFDLSVEFIKKGSSLLDLGIGTGLSSIPFYRAGMLITGIDGSLEMIKKCRLKNITETLVVADLENPSLPFEKKSFDAVISNALFHLIYPLEPLFSNVSDVIKPGGIFSFTYDNTNDLTGYSTKEKGIWEKTTDTKVWTCKYEKSYIGNLLDQNQFKILRENDFLAFRNTELKTDFWFTAVVARKI